MLLRYVIESKFKSKQEAYHSRLTEELDDVDSKLATERISGDELRNTQVLPSSG